MRSQKLFAWMSMLSLLVQTSFPIISYFPYSAYAQSADETAVESSADTPTEEPTEEPQEETPQEPAEDTSVTDQQADTPQEPEDTQPTEEQVVPEEQIPEVPTSPTPTETPDTPTTPESQTDETTPPAETQTEQAPPEDPNAQECMDAGKEVTTAPSDEWNTDGDTSKTKGSVKVGVRYEFPLDSKVAVTFTCLPKNEEKRSELSIERVKASDLSLPEGTLVDGDYAYDINTDMEDGTFAYDVSLPKTENRQVEVFYIEKSVEEAKQSLSTVDLQSVSEDSVEQESQDGSLKLKDLDHFTIFIATYSSNTFTVQKSSYVQGDTVYVKAGDLTTSEYYRLAINPPGGNNTFFITTCFNPDSNNKTLTGSYVLPMNATVANDWKAELKEFDNSNCGDSEEDREEDSFAVTAYPYTPTRICHATGNPGQWVSQTPANSGVLMGHVGGSHQNGNDIIPPIPGYLPLGQNWDATGQGIWNNDCAVPPTTGTIKIMKDAVPNDAQDFEFTGTGTGVPASFLLDDDSNGANQDNLLMTLEGGTSYTFTETAVDGWNLSTIACTGSSDYSEDVAEATVTVNLKSGENVVCTFTNKKSVTIVASKIICDDESYLPNWGTSAPDVTSAIAQSWVDDSDGHCVLASDWDFQWSLNGAGNPGDNIGEAGAGWTTFGPTDGTGKTQVEIAFPPETSQLWFREVLKPGYIPFTYGTEGNKNTNNVTAEFYCHKDGLNYDNWEWIKDFEAGATYHCVAFNALSFVEGQVQGKKYADVNADGIYDDADGDYFMDGWNIRLYDENWSAVGAGYEHTTGEDVTLGQYSYENLGKGTYYICEVNQSGWQQTEPTLADANAIANDSPNKSEEAPVCLKAEITDSGQVVQGLWFGNVELGSIHGVKWNDLNGNGVRDCIETENVDFVEQDIACELEPLLSGWTIFIDENDNQELDGGEQSMDTDSSKDHFGWYWFDDLLPGTYTVCEKSQDGWLQTFPQDPTCHTVTIPDTNRECRESLNAVGGCEYNFGNQFQDPELVISESNSVNDGAIESAPGGTVTFTIVVKALNSKVLGVVMKNLLPEGFTYQPGSYTSFSTVRGGGFLASEPQYNSPGKWELGDMVPGEEVTLTLVGTISSSIDNGVYKDATWATGTSLADGAVLAQATAPGVVTETFVGTQANVTSDPASPEAEAKVKEKKKEVEGSVLGASTLPATGASTLIFIFALLSLVFGSALIVTSARKRTGHMFRLKSRMLAVLLGLGLFLAGVVSAHAATSPLVVRISEPESPANAPFDLVFVTMDVQEREITAKCYKKGPSDGVFVQFDSTKSLIPGGNTDSCDTTGILTDQGTYQFKVTVSAGDDEQTSDISSVDYDGTRPDEPNDFEVDQKNECEYRIKFKTANDGQTSYVELYRSDSKEFTADAGSRVKTISIGPNQDYDEVDTVSGGACGKEQYYAIRAFDTAGNASDVVNETRTKTTTTEGKTTSESTTTEGALLAGGASVASGNTLDGTIITDEKGKSDEDGAVLGKSTPEEQNQNEQSMKLSFFQKLKNFLFSNGKPRFSLLLVLLVLGAGGYLVIKSRRSSR